MATYGSVVRRGLPRRPGGEPWPPAADAPVTAASVGDAAAVLSDAAVVPDAAAPVGADAAGAAPGAAAPAHAESVLAEAAAMAPAPALAPQAAAGTAASRGIRRGLPRVAGGEPWPPAGSAPASAVAAPAAAAVPAAEAAALAAPAPSAPAGAATAPTAAAAPAAASAPVAPTVVAGDSAALRRGLPRVAGGEPWPPAGFAPSAPVVLAPAPAAPAPQETPAAAALAVVEAAPAAPAAAAVPTGPRPPLTFRRTAFPGAAARTRPAPAAEPVRIGPFTRAQWAGAVIVGGAGLLYAAAMLVLFVRWFLSLEFMQDFLAAYPGEYHLPDGAPIGFPAWLGWQHFFNVFLMVLIIRSGLQVRNEKRPTAFWSPRWGDGKRKISLALWFHQSLDILWLLNGVIFVVLLFVTAQWMRIVPTSWDVIPNAVSAALQYVSLDWPTENGWVNYNGLQQLAYFATVFIAAPLAAITGVRMSGIWPKNATRLNKLYPVEWARAVHFPVMLYFVLFIFVHVVLVLSTGALRNLNHMYGGQDAVNWVGFWIFVASLVVIAAAWVAARPLVLAPIARLFGKVSGR